MTCNFDELNPIIQACVTHVDGPSSWVEEEIIICLVLEHILKSFNMFSFLKRFLCLRGYLYSHLHMYIPLFGNCFIKVNFQMLTSWPSKFLEFHVFKLRKIMF
jgi:hypothetical protein